MRSPRRARAASQVMNQLITFIFFVGIILNFLTPYRSSHLVGGAKIKSHKRIAIRYLKSWFILDVISTIPCTPPPAPTNVLARLTSRRVCAISAAAHVWRGCSRCLGLGAPRR